jgi:ribosome biogenesis SPOUT family RNA methylase Rps3
MSKLKPNIIVPFDDKERFKNLVLEVINDTSIYTLVPDSISLNGVLFTLTLANKKFVYEEIKVDGEPDYVDVYLQGIKKTANTYSVSTSGNDIVITFNQNITLRPIDIVRTDFLVKGKIVSR